MRSSLFRSLLLEISSGKNKFSVFLGSSLGKFGFIEYLDGVVCFFLYIFFCLYVFYFQIYTILFSGMPINPFGSRK